MTITGSSEPLDILGVPVTALESYDHAVQCVIERVRRREKTFCVAINAEKIYRAQSDEGLRAVIRDADLHLCDGAGTAIAARILHGCKVGRITGVQLFLDLMAAAERSCLRVFLLGADEESNRLTCRRLRQRHPQLKIVGRRDGYFRDDAPVVEEINRSRADMLFVALGSPKQEKWIAQHRAGLDVPFCMGVGGAFDVVSGRAKRAPAIFRKTGTEFLYRLIKEPKRWTRQICLPLFMFRVVRARVLRLAARRRKVLWATHPARHHAASQLGREIRAERADKEASAVGQSLDASPRPTRSRP